MGGKVKKLSGKIIFAIVCAAVIGTILITCLGMQIAFSAADKITCWSPDYEMTDVSSILAKEALGEEDYEILYKQTGLTKIGVDRMLERGTTGKAQIKTIQREYFKKREVENDLFAPFICTDFVNDYFPNVYLEDGDILVTSSTHLSGWRMGHAGLVTNAAMNRVLQASAIDDLSDIGKVQDFTDRVNFMVLSPKADETIKSEVVKYAEENLLGKPYDPTAGVFSDKYKVNRTQCAHIVWYAYYQFGINLDSNGGMVVTPRNIANSPDVELVQVFGFDPVKLWK